jgi:hypothetical protein
MSDDSKLLGAIGEVLAREAKHSAALGRARIQRSEAGMELDTANSLRGLVDHCLDEIGDFARDFMLKGKRPARLPTNGKNANPLVSGSLFPERPDR